MISVQNSETLKKSVETFFEGTLTEFMKKHSMYWRTNRIAVQYSINTVDRISRIFVLRNTREILETITEEISEESSGEIPRNFSETLGEIPRIVE